MSEEFYEFDQDELLQEADVIRQQAEQNAALAGKDVFEIEQAGKQAKYRHIIKFMELIEQYLPQLTNQSIAQLLMLLISLGAEIEDETELLAWINIIKHQAMNRMAAYFELRGPTIPEKTKSADELSPLFQKYDLADIFGLERILYALDATENASQKTDLKPENRFYRKLQKIVERDAQIKQEEEIRKTTNQQIKQQEQAQRNRENQSRLEKERVRHKNQELIKQNFSNRRNRKAVAKIAEKKNRELTEEEMKKIKIKIATAKGR